MDNLKYLKLPYKSIFSIPELKMGAVSYLWPQNGNKDIKKVLIFYPGNPGIPEYYIDFLDQIYNNLNRCLEIILSKEI
ncbi:hypothetical protein K502DRAFT_354055 [Neoconidiobolus thromboides FSU 785]|nr:hypothetical protein K502DRAFT_354055 [Neoconidiobolus thromboides FSU 785]